MRPLLEPAGVGDHTKPAIPGEGAPAASMTALRYADTDAGSVNLSVD